MVAELRAQPGVEVTEARLGQPLPEQVVASYARARGLPVTEELLTFYSFANWLRLEWRVEGAWKYGGKIGIPSLELAAEPWSWRAFGAPRDALSAPLDGYGLSFTSAADGITPFDFFARSEDNIELAGMFSRGEAVDVFVSSDDLACKTDAHLVTVGEYVDLLLRSYGSPLARSALVGGAAEQPRAAEAIPGILTKAYALEALVDLTRSEPDVGQVNEFFR